MVVRVTSYIFFRLPSESPFDQDCLHILTKKLPAKLWEAFLIGRNQAVSLTLLNFFLNPFLVQSIQAPQSTQRGQPKRR